MLNSPNRARTEPNNVITLPVQLSLRFEDEIWMQLWMDYYLLSKLRAQMNKAERQAAQYIEHNQLSLF